MNRDIFNVLVWASIAQVAGFGKAVLITYFFGVGPLLDGYYLAQTIPAMLAGIVIGVFQTGFTPLYSAHLVRGAHDDAAALLGSSLTLAAGVCVAVSVVVSALAPMLITALVGGASGAAMVPGITALRALAFLLLLNALVDCLGLALNAHHRYGAAAAAPIVNAAVASAILLAVPQWGLLNLIVGTLVGALCQLAVVLAAAHRASIRVVWGRHTELRLALRSGVAILPGLGFSNLALLVPSAFAARIGDGAVAALAIANRLHGALTQVLAIALSTVLLPHFARAIARGDGARVAADLRNGFPAVAALGAVAAIWVAVAGPGVVALIFERGAFDATATLAVARAWLWLTAGLIPTVWGIALAKALQALQLGVLLSRISGLALLVLLGICAVGVAQRELAVIAAAIGLSALVAASACASAAGPYLASETSRERRLPSGTLVTLMVFALSYGLSIVAPETLSRPFVIAVTAALVCVAVAIALKSRWVQGVRAK